MCKIQVLYKMKLICTLQIVQHRARYSGRNVMITSVSQNTFSAGRRSTSLAFAKCPIKFGFYQTGDALQ